MKVRKGQSKWDAVTHYVTLSVALREDGTYTASLGSIIPASGKRSMHYFDAEPQEWTIAPPGLAALTSAAQAALDAFWAGELD